MYLHAHIPYNLAKRIIVFVSNPAKVMIRLDELTQFLKECQYPEDVITKSFFNAKFKVQHQTPRKVKMLFRLL